MKWILWSIIIILPTAFSNAATTATDNEQRESYNSTRSQGMGGVGVAIANDETALLINPAGLGKLRDFYGTIIDPEIETNSNALDMYRTSPYSSQTELSSLVNTLVASPDKYYHYKQQIFPSLVMRNFGLGLIYKQNLDAIYDSTTTSINTNYVNDFGVVLGYNLRLFDGRIKIGVAGRLINRIELIKTDMSTTGTFDTTTLARQGFAKSGTGLGTDVGIMLAAPWKWIPTLGATMHDMGGTSYNMTTFERLAEATNKPVVTAQDLDVGFSLNPIHSNGIRSTWSIEYKHALTASTQTDKAKLYHFGAEYNFGDIFFVRFGYNQRYFTGGLELASERLQLQITTYGEEVGTATATQEDRRYAAKLSIRF